MCVVHIASKHNPPQNKQKNELTFWWDKHDCAQGEYSILSWYEDHFLALRQELIEFVYDLGQYHINSKPLHKHLEAGDRLSMWWCSLIFEKHPMLTPHFYNILKLRSLEHMLKAFAPHCNCIVLHNNDKKIIQILKQFCTESQINFQIISHKQNFKIPTLKNIFRRAYQALLPELKALIRFIWWFLTVRIHLDYVKSKAPQTPCITMLSYYPHHNDIQDKNIEQQEFRSAYWGSLQDVLLEQGKHINWLLMRVNSPKISMRQIKSALKVYNLKKLRGKSFHLAEEFLAPRHIIKSLIRYIKLNYISHTLEKHIAKHSTFKHSKVNFWSYLRPYYKEAFQGWICLERILQRQSMLSYVQWAGVQEYTLFPWENCSWERSLVEAIHHAKAGPTYGAQHSALRHTDLRYFDSLKFYANLKHLHADKLLVNGSIALTLLSNNAPTDKLLLVEALRYEHLLHFMPSNSKAKTSPKNPCKASKKLLVVTSFFEEDAKAHIKLLFQWLAKDKDAYQWQICIKAHPYNDISHMLKGQSYNGDISITKSNIATLLEELKSQGGLVWAANDTSVIIEAMYAGLPILIQGANGFDLCPIQGIDALKYVYTYKDVHANLVNTQVVKSTAQFFALDANLTRWRKFLEL